MFQLYQRDIWVTRYLYQLAVICKYHGVGYHYPAYRSELALLYPLIYAYI